MKKIFICLISIITISCSTSKKVVTTPVEPETEKIVETKVNAPAVKDASGDLIGVATKENFLEEPYSTWFSPNYDDYPLNNKVVENIKPLLENVTIKAFMGTWCEDSQHQTPVFYKILDNVNFNYNNLELITVNRSKTTPDNLQEGFNIIRVPTFIFYKDGNEIGRFVEYPRETVEKDLLKILNGDPYKHSYDN